MAGLPVELEELVTSVGDASLYDFAECATRLDPMGPYDKRDVVAAICFTIGNFAQMGRLLGRNRARVRDFVLRNPDIKAIYDDVVESVLDEIEEGVLRSALAGDPADRRFILQTRAKNRGYTTRQEMTGKDEGPMQVISVDQLANMDSDNIKNALKVLKEFTPTSG